MGKKDKILSRYIDRLNAGKRPSGKRYTNAEEIKKLFDTIRLVHSLKEPDIPSEEYNKKLVNILTKRLAIKDQNRVKRQRWTICLAATAGVMILAVLLSFYLSLGNINIVSAMEKAYSEIKAYHGLLVVEEINQAGESFMQAKLEVWKDKEGRYYTKQLEGSQSGLVTVNNGLTKWQLIPEEKQAYLFSAFPDPYRYTLELGKEIEAAGNALESRIVGEESISGRKTKIIEVTPNGGLPYKLWIDKETNLPLQKQTAMQNALQYKITYTEITFEDSIPGHILEYVLPEGFLETDENPEQIVNNLEEAFEIAGFYPDIPKEITGYVLESIAVNMAKKSIKMNYSAQDLTKRLSVIESKSDITFEIASTGVIGKIGGALAEIQSPVQQGLGILGTGPYAGMNGINSIRWQRGGNEYAVVGNISLDEIVVVVKNLKLGDVEIPKDHIKEFNPQIDVPVDMDIENNEQKSVDAGHSQWRLDHEFVAQVFASLKVSSEGIVGDYPIREDQLTTICNTGIEAIVEISGDTTVIRKVYLKRLVRQDSTGIWTVVGYDPV